MTGNGFIPDTMSNAAEILEGEGVPTSIDELDEAERGYAEAIKERFDTEETY